MIPIFSNSARVALQGVQVPWPSHKLRGSSRRLGSEDALIPQSSDRSKCRGPTLNAWKRSVLTEQVLNCRKVKYGLRTLRAAVRVRRVKTNFTSSPRQ